MTSTRVELQAETGSVLGQLALPLPAGFHLPAYLIWNGRLWRQTEAGELILKTRGVWAIYRETFAYRVPLGR